MSTRQTFYLIGALVLFFAFVSGSLFLWVFGGSFFFITWFQRWWAGRLARCLSLTWDADQSRVMPHTPVTVRLTMHNRSWLPLPQTRLQFTLPEHVQVEGADQVMLANKRTQVQLWISVPRRARVERQFTLIPTRRGMLWLHEVQAEVIDLFGDAARSIPLPVAVSLLVYPELLPVPAVTLGDSMPAGKRLSRQRIQEDVTFLRGIRAYRPGDRLKHLDWKASAKTGALQTRLFDYTASARWRVVGYILPSFEPLLQRYNDNLNERTVSVLAAIAQQCRKEGLTYEVFMSIRHRGKTHYHGAAGSGKTHYVQLMTQLARLHQFVATPLEGLLRRLEGSKERSPILIVTPRLEPEEAAAIQRLAQRGLQVLLIHAAEDPVTIEPLTPVVIRKGVPHHAAT